ncbi:MAG: asparagine synthase (glutamine-hydrolyzing) [Gammaproteobacteria bacterium]|nr:MAG: asparagine synthase (glutamine-hydrolyzing) [Gammaproteobacteria bacterium]
MCGISGVVDFDNITQAEIDSVLKINQSIVHRGPDADGLFSDESVVLAHRRLSIIDISESSNQPMFDGNGDIVLVFNGEIYNHVELRKELEQEFEFKTDHSDTETIIYAYKKWGVSCVDKFVGMFAFALYDKSKGSVFICRDRLGKKPIYYSQVGNAYYFCSESSALFTSGKIEKKINAEAIYDYLSYLTVEAPNTFFEGVYKIPAGHYMEINKAGTSLVKYWDIANYLNIECKDSEKEIINRTKLLLDKSMEHRNVSDVPIAVALSGGLDSSLNLDYTKNISENKLIAINVSYVDKSQFDESDIAKRFSEELGVEFVSVCIDKQDYENWILEYFQAQKDTPIGDPNSPLLYGISKVAAQHGCKVLQVGEGGDEIGGYPIYNSLVKLNRLTKFIPKYLLKLCSLLPIPSKYKRELDILSSGGAETRRFLFGFTDAEKNKFWKKSKYTSSFEKLSKYAAEIRDDLDDSFLRKVLNIEYKVRLAEMLLPRVDYPSMAASVEARSPFMDHQLIEYSASVSFSVKMKVGPKTIIRNIASKILPNYLMEQPKVGFGMLLNPFLNNDLPVWFKKEMLDVNSPIQEFIDKDFLNKIYKKHLIDKSEGYRMWILFSLNKWLEINSQ